jgi:hypothetical protein
MPGQDWSETVWVSFGGRWWDEVYDVWRSATGRVIEYDPPHPLAMWEITAQIGCSHVDGDPRNNDPANLRMLCRRCHLLADKPQHKRTRQTRKDQRRPLLAELVER